MLNKKSYYAIIPAKIRYDNKLEMGARLLYGEITALCNEKGFCWASSKYFSDLYEVECRTIRRWIDSLKKSKYIKVEINGLNRQIFIMEDYSFEKIDDDGNVVKKKEPKYALPKQKKNVVARNLQMKFRDMAKKFLKVDVVMDKVGYFSVLRAMNQGKMTPEQIEKLFMDWFMTQGDERITSITAALSNRNIEKYKYQNGIISK